MIKAVIIPTPTAKNAKPAGNAGVNINIRANTIIANITAIVIIKILFITIMIFSMPDTMIL